MVVSISHGDRTGVASWLNAWDGRWFLLAAQHGYPSSLSVVFGNAAQSTLGFFPAFPVPISLMHLATTISYESAAIMGQ